MQLLVLLSIEEKWIQELDFTLYGTLKLAMQYNMQMRLIFNVFVKNVIQIKKVICIGLPAEDI